MPEKKLVSNNKKRKVAELMNLANTYFNEQKLNEAGGLCQQALEIDPQNGNAFNTLGLIAVSLKKYTAAESLYQQACQCEPGNALYWNNLGSLCVTLKRFKEAETHFNKSLDLEPGHYHALSNLGALLLQFNRPDIAKLALEQALKKKPNSSLIHNLLGNALAQTNAPDSANVHFKKALKINPKEMNAHYMLGQNYFNEGQFEKAEEHFRQELYYYPETTVCYERLVKMQRYDEKDSSKLENLFQRPGLSIEDKANAAFALARIKELEKDYEASFAFLNQANMLYRSTFTYDITQDAGMFSDFKTFFSDAFMQQIPQHNNPGQTPIFILGLPRSGTSLVEQIIAAHPQVFGCGEVDTLDIIAKQLYQRAKQSTGDQALNFAEIPWSEAAQTYSNALATLTDNTKSYITDKTPANFQYIGFIHAMFPDAKIIHCHRDKMDNGLSLYRETFAGKAYQYAYDLGELGEYYALYEDLMNHWRDVLPVNAIYELTYEKLVQEPKSEILSLLAYCGLDRDEACINFHQTTRLVKTASAVQVRQPIYATSVQGWLRFASQLQPLAQKFNLAERN
ncbi:MAG: hypothetical protein AUK35_00440 [Zetaproteobacteria bacterium CG2_30_46_52]|nr:MAG: hypothetical protein AUK35_00440 [Zetaproteobacteria bacterium CG2_30_46_52]